MTEQSKNKFRKPEVLTQTQQDDQSLKILERFGSVAARVSDKVLYELFGHFQRRKEDQTTRFITLPGERQQVELPLLKAMDGGTVEMVEQTIIGALKEKFSKLGPIGSCWIDPKLKNIPLPTNMRTVSESLQVVVRGSRIPLENPNAKVVRFYVHWKDEKGTIDLDLSSTFVGKGSREVISWCTGYKTAYGCHSGDVRHRVGDCAEYVDIDIAEAQKRFDYAIVDVRNYDRRTLGEVAPVFGYMEREQPESSDIWVPKTVRNSFVMKTKSSNAIAIAFDIQTLEYIVLDIDMAGSPVAYGNTDEIMKHIKALIDPPAVSVYDLLNWHVESRKGTLVADEDKETADQIFRFEDFATTYVNTLKWMRAD